MNHCLSRHMPFGGIERFKELFYVITGRDLRMIFLNNNIIYFNLASQYYKLMKLCLSLLSERREM
jgi:hypothetical protein